MRTALTIAERDKIDDLVKKYMRASVKCECRCSCENEEDSENADCPHMEDAIGLAEEVVRLRRYCDRGL